MPAPGPAGSFPVASVPSSAIAAPPAPVAPLFSPPAPAVNMGGFLRLVSAQGLQMQEDKDQAEKDAHRIQAQPALTGLASHIRSRWMLARQAKLPIETRMYAALRQRRGEYEPDKLAAIRQSGGSEIYMMISSVKCRAAGAWLRDILGGEGGEKPWTIQPTPVPTMQPQFIQDAIQRVTQDIVMAYGAGMVPTDDQIKQQLLTRKDEIIREVQEEATEFAARMETYMEDQLDEGGWAPALHAFVDDITTYPSAVLKGPVVRKVPKARWEQDPKTQQWNVQVEDTFAPFIERVDPFNIYPMPDMADVEDGDLIERHKMQRSDLTALKGVDGYDDKSIDLVLDTYGRGGLREWLINDFAKAAAQGQTGIAVTSNANETIDALQYWGSVQGKMLREWGMDAADIPDELAEYQVEAWLIGPYVIKAVLNYDPLGRKPYFKASFETVPGLFWGNGVTDLVRDVQDVCNAAARALVNNMGIASGPQACINIERLPSGEDVTQMFPWKIWQVNESQTGSTIPPMEFFQPQSNAAELMAIFDKFSALADEYSGIPRYMTGDMSASIGGLGRTASGISMMLDNAGKSIKQVVSAIDTYVIAPFLDKLYFYNMRYGPDEVKGDAQIVARGAQSLIQRESAAQRRNEFLAATLNPMDAQIMGPDGRAAVLREQAKTLGLNVDRVIPSPEAMRQRAQIAAQQQAMMAQAQAQAQGGAPGGPGPGGPGPGVPVGVPPQAGGPSPSGQTLSDGRPITDLHSPVRGA